MTPEFPRPFRIDALGEGDRAVSIEADDAERADLARRFGLLSIEALSADAVLIRKGEIVTATGRLRARLTQACVASGVPIPVELAEPFTLRFVPELAPDAPEELELSEDDCDIVDYAGGAIDLGEAVADSMALALDPFPRSPDADAILKEAGVVSEDEAEIGPFAGLKALKDKLGG